MSDLPILISVAVVVVLVVFVLSWTIVIVPQQEVRLMERLGKFHRLLFAGLHFKIPLIDRIVGRYMTLRIQQLDVTVSSKTRDNVFVDLRVSTQFQVIPERVYDAYYKLTSVGEQMQSYIFDVVRSRIPAMPLDEVFENKDAVARALQEELGATMENFGYKIIRSLITDINPDSKVKAAMNEINEQLRLKLAAKEQAEGEKIRRVKAAEADAEAMRLTGIGLSQQRTAIVNGLRNSIEDFSEAIEGVSAKDVMNLVLRVQYYDMLKDVTTNSNSNTLLLPSTDSLGEGGLDSALRKAIMTANLATKDKDYES